jgi:hypothetical protein
MSDGRIIRPWDWTRRSFLAAAGSGIGLPADAQIAASGQPIVCRIVDQETGRPVPARVRLVDEHSNELVPLGMRIRSRLTRRRATYASSPAAIPTWTASSA